MKITTSNSMIKPILRGFFMFYFYHGVCSNNYFEYDTATILLFYDFVEIY